MRKAFCLILFVFSLSGVFGQPAAPGEARPYFLTLKNKRGLSVKICNYGARIASLIVPDRNGKPVDVVLGFATPEEYTQPKAKYYGPVVGRFGNRIAGGKFSLNGKTYTLNRNNGPNSLHGGKRGFGDVYWTVSKHTRRMVELTYTSPDGEEGYPGTLQVSVTYRIGKDNRLDISYRATTDQATVLNLTNHSFFNLNGEGSGDVLKHKLQMNAFAYTPVDKDLIPTGEILTVAGTPFDFLSARAIGADLDTPDEQLRFGQGYDHNFVLRKHQLFGLYPALRLTGDKSSIVMSIWTSEPGMQFYSGNFFNGKTVLRSGAKDVYRGAVALEPQHFPDSPNQPGFPGTVLNPGTIFKSKSSYRFSVEKTL
ncbi:aldose epimerase family protein [Pedobacter sp. SYP-B3415]|uniref:aldose epimerase family protein n=1 Tax=Pedobacter sp. SYP-B3415 TaxID=2496641 RepID=UPI0013EDE3EE|nr:aldose epimerase family protein [Pedobacter sp. SYP-B3415]